MPARGRAPYARGPLRRRRLTPATLLALLLVLAATVWLAANARIALRWIYPVYYLDRIVYWAGEHGLDPWLVAAVVRVESNFRPTAISPRGARGLMQLLPETASWAAKQTGERHFFADQLFDAEVNLRLGTWYLAQLLREFGGRETLALAAYNAGRSRVERWLLEASWDGSEAKVDAIPFGETRRFVARVLRIWRLYAWIHGA